MIIVGAGIIGGSIAWRLAQRGLTVELFDARGFGEEASWAGAGMLACGGEITEQDVWGRFAIESARGYPDFVQELREESGLRIDYRVCGALELANDAGEWAELRGRAARQAGFGIASEPLDGAAAAAAVPGIVSDGLAGAMLYPGDAVVNPRDVMAALRCSLAKRSVTMHEGTPVTRIRASASTVEAQTAAGVRAAGAVVLAAGAWSSRIGVMIGETPYEAPHSVPIRGHLISWNLPPGSLGPIVRHRHTYLFQRSSGVAIAGSSEERVGFDRTLDSSTVADLAGRARRLLPALFCSPPHDAWIGFRPGTESGLPAMGRADESPVWLAYGHYRNGILMAPATAHRIASEISAS